MQRKVSLIIEYSMDKEVIKRVAFVPSKCDHCGQFVDYELQISRGHALALAKMYNYCKLHDKDSAHLDDDLLARGFITANMKGNIPQLRHWKLLTETEVPGVWALNERTLAFLKDELVVNKKVIVNKGGVEEFVGAYQPEITTTFSKLLKKENPFWEGDYIKW